MHISLQPPPAAACGSCSSLQARLVSDFRAKQAATRVLQRCCSARGRPSAVSGSSGAPSMPPSPGGMAGYMFYRATDRFGLAGPLEPTQLLPLPWARPLPAPPAPPGSLGRGFAALRGKDSTCWGQGEAPPARPATLRTRTAPRAEARSEHPAFIPPATKARLRPQGHQRAVASERQA